MTATTDSTVYTLLKYEHGRRSHPWGKRNRTILIQSDSKMLSQTITDTLQQTCHLISLNQCDPPSVPEGADLIILALSGPNILPVVALTRAYIARQVGKTPIVMLSQQPFDSSRTKGLHHLSLPIEPEVLRHRVRTLLH
jgi:DNA-binding response OmpR family regulator